MQLRRHVVAQGIAVLLSLMALNACSSGSHDSPTSPSSATAGESTGSVNAGPFVFRASPVAVEAIRWITPLGNLNPPDHTVPTDHIYFYIAAPDAGESFVTMRTAFFAPADGTVTTLFGAVGAESKIVVRATSTISYYIDHIIPDVTVSPGTRLAAGQRLGTSGAAYAVDLGVINTGLTLTGFANPARYPSDTLHADAPLKYYEEPLRSQLYAKVQRLGSDRDGKIDFDVPGRLAGNWYVENGTNAVAFAYNTYDPAQVRISIGGILATNGVFSTGAAEPRPRDVSVESGLVRYTLTRARTGLPLLFDTPFGSMLVQMLTDTRMRAEVFAANSRADAFTSNARTFIR